MSNATALDIIKGHSSKEFTGCLILRRMNDDEGTFATLYLSEGRIYSALINNEYPPIGVRIFSSGRVSPEDFREALEAANGNANDPDFYNSLIEDELISERTLHSYIKDEFLATMRSVLSWDDVDYEWRVGEVTQAFVVAPIPLKALFTKVKDNLATISGIMEEVRLLTHDDTDPEDIEDEVDVENLVPYQIEAPNQDELSPDHFSFFQKLNGKTKLGDLCNEYGYVITPALRTVYILWVKGHVGLYLYGNEADAYNKEAIERAKDALSYSEEEDDVEYEEQTVPQGGLSAAAQAHRAAQEEAEAQADDSYEAEEDYSADDDGYETYESEEPDADYEEESVEAEDIAAEDDEVFIDDDESYDHAPSRPADDAVEHEAEEEEFPEDEFSEDDALNQDVSAGESVEESDEYDEEDFDGAEGDPVSDEGEEDESVELDAPLTDIEPESPTEDVVETLFESDEDSGADEPAPVEEDEDSADESDVDSAEDAAGGPVDADFRNLGEVGDNIDDFYTEPESTVEAPVEFVTVVPDPSAVDTDDSEEDDDVDDYVQKSIRDMEAQISRIGTRIENARVKAEAAIETQNRNREEVNRLQARIEELQSGEGELEEVAEAQTRTASRLEIQRENLVRVHEAMLKSLEEA